MTKKPFYTEIAYILGLVSLALGTALMEKADYGLSMVVAPAYVLYLKLSSTWSFITFGMMEYIFQGILLLFMVLILRKFRVYYLFSFVTAVIYGVLLDISMAMVSWLPFEGTPYRLVCFLLGLMLCTLGVAFMFHSYIAPEVYELFVKETSSTFSFNINKFKTVYDCISCIFSIILSFSLFGFLQFEGIKFGTILSALLNGWIISLWSKWMDNSWEFTDRLQLRSLFL